MQFNPLIFSGWLKWLTGKNNFSCDFYQVHAKRNMSYKEGVCGELRRRHATDPW